MATLPSGTVTFLFTDVEGSTRLLEELGAEAYAAALAEHRRVVRDACTRYGGVEVDTQGDAFFLAFATAPGAVAAAAEITNALEAGPIHIRVGLHTGAPLVTDEGYVGADVHRAARIAAAGHGGQVLVSASTAALVDGGVLRDLGEHRFKDLAAAARVFQLGEADFPPLKSLYRTNLPVPATAFLGREQELAEVVELLTRDDIRLLTLTGPGGTGKTRLALQAAAEVGDRYPDGLWWVPLAPLRDSSLVLPAVAQTLDAKERPGTPLMDTVRATLAGKAALLLLDNAEHLLPEVASDVACLRGVDGPTVLVTTRERLQLQGENVWAVPSLGDDDGVALFTTRARALQPAFEPSAVVADVCARLDNLPLAIELAAARTVVFSPDQLLERLGQRLDLLKGGRDADARQRTLRTTIEWSYGLLTPDEQRLFAGLSIFVGGCTYEAAEDVCDADPDVLQSLIDKSLLRRRDTEVGTRYWMLETIREYALERLGASVDEALHARYIDHFVDSIQRQEVRFRGVDEGAAFSAIRHDLPNVRRALEWALAAGNADAALRLAGGLHAFWYHSGYFAEGRRWAEEALRFGGETAIREKALGAAGEFALLQGDVEAARALLSERLELCRRLGDADRLASVYTLLGHVASLEADWEDALALYERSLELAEREGVKTTVWQGRDVSLSNIGWALLNLGKLDAAEARLRDALVAADERGSTVARAVVLNNLARVELARRDVAALRRYLEDSARACVGVPDPRVLNEWFELAARLLSLEERGAGCARAVGAAQYLRELVGVAAELEEVPDGELVDQARDRMTSHAWADELAVGRSRAAEDPVALAADCLD
jgi:predicted ATPase